MLGKCFYAFKGFKCLLYIYFLNNNNKRAYAYVQPVQSVQRKKMYVLLLRRFLFHCEKRPLSLYLVKILYIP